jgi:thiol:disulfide interchange protein/DsbC/DsbD-like thiol-disulfide interchange protein
MAKVTLKTTRRRMQVLMGRIAAVVFGLALSVGLAAPAPAQIGEKRPLVRAELIAEHMAARRGETLTVALRQTITPGWHTYWQNPGDSGEPTSLDWNLPAGITSGPIQWPLPEAIPVGPLTNYGYSDNLLLLTDITIPADAAGQSVTLSAKARWLVCKDICVPEESPVSLTLPLIDGGLSPRRSSDAAAIAAAREALPKPAPWPVRYSHSLDKLTLNVDGLGSDIGKITHVRFFPVNWGQIANAMPQKTALSQDKLSVRMLQGETPPAAGAALEGLLALEGTGPDGAKFRRGYVVSAVNVPAPALATPDSDPLDVAQAAGDAVPLGFGVALLFAFLGGLILNLMPCVFPVLSLKAYALAREASDTRHGARGGLAYLAGVLASFGVIAAGLMVLRTAGVAAGWGIQFQSPGFVLTLAALFLLLGLNMSGVFEFGGSLTGAGDSLTRRDGLAGSFFTGVLATAVATPCTAPFMGAAIGYAFAQPAVQATAVLMALGLGFALPMLLLSLSPALGRLLPKPGLWMVRFKQVMAFPLYATAAWLVWVLSVQLGSDGVFAAMVTLLVVAFAAWLFGLSGGPRSIAKAAALIVAIAGLAGGAVMLSGAQPSTGTTGTTAESGPPAEAFTQARLDGLLAEGKPVFVNFTAAWCITCKVNERVALRSDRLAEAFRQRGITYLKGDWTNANPEITAMLNSFGRAGVPLYLLYSGVPGSQPQVLPQLLTESMVLGRVAELSPSPLKQANGGS